ITRICNCDAKSNENFVIKVTDSALLSRCGGIVQGMSGSPIVQDGKLAGAVTHVFLENPEEGYGIMAQNMVSNYQE
ncbi:MAG: SpoIVB peptidase S55 domain-containing protein, partial [Ruminococcus sp.]|nr:SpoIVB peptidase S55 domain-containing protein [Ruminococcus sp.]